MTRSFALLGLALTLGLPACGGDENTPTGSDTDQTTNPPVTTDDMTTTSGTTGPDQPTTTVEPTSTTVEPETSTTVEPETTTVEPETSTTVEPETTTGETDTAGETDTGGVSGDAYGPCSNEDPANTGCPDGQQCIDDLNTQGQVMGSYCAPLCEGPNKMCPTPDGVDGAQGICTFGAMPMMPTFCALVCNPDMDGCPAPSTCFDTGQMQQGQKIGICTHPK